MADPTVLEVYRREITPDLYKEIRELYKTHSIAEDARDLPGLISTLTPDCVYELVQSGHRWEGHDGVWILNPGSPTERRSAPARTMLELVVTGRNVAPTLVSLGA